MSENRVGCDQVLLIDNPVSVEANFPTRFLILTGLQLSIVVTGFVVLPFTLV